MAGVEKPTEDILIGGGKEGQIEFLESDYVYDTVESLVDGSLTSATGYGVLLTVGVAIHFKVKYGVNLYAYGKNYYDSGGSTQHSLSLYKLNETTKQYDYISKEIPETDTWKLLFKEMEPGTYKVVCDGTYTSMTEWFIEVSSVYLIKKDKYYYNVQDENYDYLNKEYNSLVVQNLEETFDKEPMLSFNELFEEKNINEEIFKPITKFDDFSICRKK